MPVAYESVDLIVNTFSPLAREEVYRSLKHGGYFVMAIPAEEHLFGLKSAIYDTPYKNEVADTEISGFQLLAAERVSYTLTLDSSEKIKDLFMMTPYAYRTRESDKQRILSLDELVTEVDFVVFAYKKV